MLNSFAVDSRSEAMHFLDVKTDYAFKRVFASEGSQPVLISFLDAILYYDGEQAIVDLTIVDPYQIPLLLGMKDTYVDVKAVLANGQYLIIEMQVLNVAGFEKRILHNAAKEYATQWLRDEDYTLLNPVIALTFTDFCMFDGSPKAPSRWPVTSRPTPRRLFATKASTLSQLKTGSRRGLDCRYTSASRAKWRSTRYLPGEPVNTPLSNPTPWRSFIHAPLQACRKNTSKKGLRGVAEQRSVCPRRGAAISADRWKISACAPSVQSWRRPAV